MKLEDCAGMLIQNVSISQTKQKHSSALAIYSLLLFLYPLLSSVHLPFLE